MELNLKNCVIFIISFCVIVLFLLLIIDGNKRNINTDNIKSNKNNYPEYKVDELVKLKDGSQWYVLEDSYAYDKDIYLFSKDKVNEEVVTDATYYVRNTYLDKLCNDLAISRNEITDIRLLKSSDICNIYDISCEGFGTKFDRTKFELLKTDTLVDYTLDGKQLSLCDEGFCNNDNTNIRVVVKIAKYFIEEEQ